MNEKSKNKHIKKGGYTDKEREMRINKALEEYKLKMIKRLKYIETLPEHVTVKNMHYYLPGYPLSHYMEK